MGEGPSPNEKSTKAPPRPPKTPSRQARFEDTNDTNNIQVTSASEHAERLRQNSNSNANANPNPGGNQSEPPAGVDTQPTSFPAVGLPPETQQQQAQQIQQAQLGPGRWFIAANPTQSAQSVSRAVYQLPAGYPHAQPLNPDLHYSAAPQHPSINVTMAADYQNATPLPTNPVNYQPPVPDTTHGPMNHVYIPRFDGGGPPQQAHAPPGFQQPIFGGGGSQQPAYIVHPQPIYMPHPSSMNGHPPMVGPAPQFQHGPAPVACGGGFVGGGLPPFVTGNTGPSPDVAGLGRTTGEEQLRQLNFAHANKMFEPQDFKPSDDDPSRFYYVRELDGNWTQRSRFTIDHMGDSRWYVTDEGWFYAVRLPN